MSNRNSSNSISPEPSSSTSLTKFWRSYSLGSAPSLLNTLPSSTVEIDPLPSSSNSLNTANAASYSSDSSKSIRLFWFAQTALMWSPISKINSSKSIRPEPSASAFETIFASYFSFKLMPIVSNVSMSSSVVIVPDPSASNTLKASLANSNCFYVRFFSSVTSSTWIVTSLFILI